MRYLSRNRFVTICSLSAMGEGRGAPPRGHVAVVGCGVIGAGWAARLLLSGCDVRVFDPAPNAEPLLRKVIANATQAWNDLDVLPDHQGHLSVCRGLEDAVDGARFIQESVPERPDLKASVFAEIEAVAATDALIGTSTSGIKPSQLQTDMRHPERLVVGHPYNPVYLLPVVEVVGGEHTLPITIERAQAFYASIGMRPVHVQVEIDAFIGDRLLEAVWREALWLVNDGVATTEEIDAVITHGFGLRWAQMGLFETYRVAGGAGGFRHFIAQFGPALEWPWTKLMDTPDFTPELVDKLVQQSDAQSGAHTLSELERIRDQNLVGFLKVLEQNRWAAGTTLADLRIRHS